MNRLLVNCISVDSIPCKGDNSGAEQLTLLLKSLFESSTRQTALIGINKLLDFAESDWVCLGETEALHLSTEFTWVELSVVVGINTLK